MSILFSLIIVLPITVSAIALHLTFAFVICYPSNKEIPYNRYTPIHQQGQNQKTQQHASTNKTWKQKATQVLEIRIALFPANYYGKRKSRFTHQRHA